MFNVTKFRQKEDKYMIDKRIKCPKSRFVNILLIIKRIKILS